MDDLTMLLLCAGLILGAWLLGRASVIRSHAGTERRIATLAAAIDRLCELLQNESTHNRKQMLALNECLQAIVQVLSEAEECADEGMPPEEFPVGRVISARRGGAVYIATKGELGKPTRFDL